MDGGDPTDRLSMTWICQGCGELVVNVNRIRACVVCQVVIHDECHSSVGARHDGRCTGALAVALRRPDGGYSHAR